MTGPNQSFGSVKTQLKVLDVQMTRKTRNEKEQAPYAATLYAAIPISSNMAEIIGMIA